MFIWSIWLESMCFSRGRSRYLVYIYQVAWSSSMWLQAKHLHTSAECRVSPVASLSSPELLSDLFTCSPHAAQAKRTRGIKGEKMVRKWKVGRGTGWGQVKRDIRDGRERRQWARKEHSGNDKMLMMRGAGGKTHSVVVYRLTEPMKGWWQEEGGENENNTTEIQ